MRGAIKLVASFAALAFVFVGPAYSRQSPGRPSGTVLDGHTGSGLASIPVHLIEVLANPDHSEWERWRSSWKRVRSTETDAEGNFRFEEPLPRCFRFDIDLPPELGMSAGDRLEQNSSVWLRGQVFPMYRETLDRVRAKMIDACTGEPLAHCLFKVGDYHDNSEYVISDEDGWAIER